MLKKMEGLPENVLGFEAEGKVTREDYEKVMVPVLQDSYRKGEKIRFLYRFGPDFSGFSPAGAWEDFRVGMRYLRLLERCAVVGDSDWVLRATELFTPFLPFPVKTYPENRLEEALDWLAAPEAESDLRFELRENGVLVLRPLGPLQHEDFERISALIDPWIESHHSLKGLVVCAEDFPGWKNFSSMLHHMQFVRSYHRKISRIALAMNGRFPELAEKVADHFVRAEIRHFPFGRQEEAIEWAGSGESGAGSREDAMKRPAS